MFPCDCHLHMARAKIQNLVGKTILAVQIVPGSHGNNFMIVKAQDMGEWNSKIYYLCIEMGGQPDDGDRNRASVEELVDQEFDHLIAKKVGPDDVHRDEKRVNEDGEKCGDGCCEDQAAEDLQDLPSVCSVGQRPADICAARVGKGEPCDRTTRPFDSVCQVHAAPLADDAIAVANLPQTTKDIFIAKGPCGVYDIHLYCVLCGNTSPVYGQTFLACDQCVLMSQECKFVEIKNRAAGTVQFRLYDEDTDDVYGPMPISLEEVGKRLKHYRDAKYAMSAGVIGQVISWTCTETEESRAEEEDKIDVFG